MNDAMIGEDWESAFDWDGSLRDIYVLDTTIDHWRRLWDFLRSSGYKLTFNPPEPEPLPESVDGLFTESEKDTNLLRVDLGGPILCCHFFTEKEIELDIDPREVRTKAAAELIFTFMRRLGRELGEPVRLTPENVQEIVLYLYRPDIDAIEKGVE